MPGRRLGLVQRLRLLLFGRVPVGYRNNPGWRAPILHYAFRCPRHGVVESYSHGHYDRLDCPRCGYSVEFGARL